MQRSKEIIIMFTLDRISPALFATSPADFEVIEYRIEADYIEEYLAISKNEKKVIVKDEGKSQAKSKERSRSLLSRKDRES